VCRQRRSKLANVKKAGGARQDLDLGVRGKKGAEKERGKERKGKRSWNCGIKQGKRIGGNFQEKRIEEWDMKKAVGAECGEGACLFAGRQRRSYRKNVNEKEKRGGRTNEKELRPDEKVYFPGG